MKIIKTTMKIFTLFALLIVTAISSPAWAVNFGVFGDTTFNESTEAGAKNEFVLGALDLYAQQEIDDQTRAFVELVVEHDGSSFVVDLERFWISRRLTDYLNITAGRMHTPIGKWNRTYHHGALLYDTVTRPFFLEFEDANAAVLPVHFIGILADGEFSAGSATLGYEVYVGNGPSYDTDGGLGTAEIGISNTSDANNAKSPGFRISYSPDAIPLQISIFGMFNDIAETGVAGASGVATGETLIEQDILGMDLTYEGDNLDVLAEFYSLDNEDFYSGAGSHTGDAFYVQLGYRVTEALKPVYRFSSLDFDNNDAYFVLLGAQQQERHVYGLRYDLDDSNAVKIQGARVDPEVGDSFNEYAIQWAFLIP